jgi:preprotein translocase subunit SecA
MSFLSYFFQDKSARYLKKFQATLEKINSLEKTFKTKSDTELKEFTSLFKKRLREKETLENILPEAFALVREAARRTLSERHFDVQILGGMVLHKGNIAEMKTGEGKTLVATLPAYLNALTDKGVHIITVNDYLASRDAEWMGQIYNFLGLEVGVILNGQSFEEKKKAYAADITYGTNNEFGFDYLRDNMAIDLSQIVQRSLSYCIVDEVDSILIDEARTPLIISAPDTTSSDLYYKYAKLVPKLEENKDFNIDEKARSVMLTDQGINKVEKLLGIQNIYAQDGIKEVHHLEQALKAYLLFKKDRDYVVKNNEILIVDEFTGRLMQGRRYSEGLHQAIEAKEKVTIQKESRTLATITFQNYFRLYQKLAGMTGTALSSEEEFQKVYNLDVIAVPTNEPVARVDHSDQIYSTENGKFKAVVEKIKSCHHKGQPVLVGTIAIEKSEKLSSFLNTQGIPHEVLNAKHHEQEAKIIEKAGQKGAVTIATNMAGRGTDIKLDKETKTLGGLYVLGTERHEARRIDNQLRGRSGRQGDPGESQFYVSMEDDLMRIFGSDRMKRVMQGLGLPEDQSIENRFISKSIENAQKKVEGHNFDLRKHVLEYDDVINKQREYIYKLRRKILEAAHSENSFKLKEVTKNYFQEEIENLVSLHTVETPWNTQEIYENVFAIWNASSTVKEQIETIANEPLANHERREKLIKYLIDKIKEEYDKKENEVSSQNMRQIERGVILKIIDTLWMDHLDNITYLRDSIGLQGYAQKNPLVEYRRIGYRYFQTLLANIRSQITTTLFKVNLVTKINSPLENKNISTNSTDESQKKLPQKKKDKVGRNDPCPCGSGKKYKKCCGH